MMTIRSAGTLNIQDPKIPGKVQIVNFRPAQGAAAIQRATPSGEIGDPFAYVRLPELIALKLFAGSPADKRDIEAVLEANPDANVEEIRRVCDEFGLKEELERVLQKWKRDDGARSRAAVQRASASNATDSSERHCAPGRAFFPLAVVILIRLVPFEQLPRS